MVRSRPLLFAAFTILILIMFASNASAAERQYHLDHEWVKIWINQDGTIDLFYDISGHWRFAPWMNFPKRNFGSKPDA